MMKQNIKVGESTIKQEGLTKARNSMIHRPSLIVIIILISILLIEIIGYLNIYNYHKSLPFSKSVYDVVIDSILGFPILIFITFIIRKYIKHKENYEKANSSISLRAAEEKIRFMVYYDTLTGLPNKAYFKEHLGLLIDKTPKEGNLMVMFLDLDRFKVINDTLGHAAGDELLKQTANRLKSAVRDEDIVVRMGGDEFIIALPNTKASDRLGLTQSIIDLFKEPFKIDEHDIYITTSIGVSLYPDNGLDFNSLVKNADTAMFKAKENGRDTYQIYKADMNNNSLVRLEMENYLRKALEKEELFLVYQPRIHTQTGNIVGAEALLRWRCSKLGLVSPADFIPIAEESGLIHEIGIWVLKSACQQGKLWMENGLTDFKVSVNISAVQFQKENLVDSIKAILNETKFNTSNLELEITENTIMYKTNRTLSMLKELKKLGISISIDDFGTGFSSLSYIKEFNLDILKIDKSFIMDIGNCITNESIITAIINMAHSMGMRVVAEGVEKREHMEFLENKNCDEVQGYLLSKPVPPEDLMSFVVKSGNKVIKIA